MSLILAPLCALMLHRGPVQRNRSQGLAPRWLRGLKTGSDEGEKCHARVPMVDFPSHYHQQDLRSTSDLNLSRKISPLRRASLTAFAFL
jgi:hypothetical protein